MDRKGDTNERGLWAEASAGGSTRRAHAERIPYDCAELLDFLAKHPEADNPLIQDYIARQRGECRKDT
jgi:hypothetical protein